MTTQPNDPALRHPNLLDRAESALEHLAEPHRGDRVTQPTEPVAPPLAPPNPPAPPQVFEPAQTVQLTEVVSFHGPNSFFDVTAARLELDFELVAHPSQASAPRVKICNLTIYEAGAPEGYQIVQLDQPTATKLAKAIQDGFASG